MSELIEAAKIMKILGKKQLERKHVL